MRQSILPVVHTTQLSLLLFNCRPVNRQPGSQEEARSGRAAPGMAAATGAAAGNAAQAAGLQAQRGLQPESPLFPYLSTCAA